ncbi:MAG: tetratricopeptide repeat protein [Pseudomonadota bacterium]
MKALIAGLCMIALMQGGVVQAQNGQGQGTLAIPEAPEVVPPGWPPPENLCAIEATHDFDQDPLNPGLLTTDQFRTWAISGADRANPRHLLFLGIMHDYGRGVQKSQRRADDYYKKAAALGEAGAMVRLGKSYCQRKLYCLAAQSFHAAALRDDDAGQMMLSKLYRWGLGVYYDPVTAYKWGHLAMEKTPGNWLLHNIEGVNYLADIENIITDDEFERAKGMIDDFKKGFNQGPVICREE